LSKAPHHTASFLSCAIGRIGLTTVRELSKAGLMMQKTSEKPDAHAES